MEPKSNEGMFVGYSSISKAYRVFNNIRMKIEESINVTFNASDVQSGGTSQSSINLLDELAVVGSQYEIPHVEIVQQDFKSEDESTQPNPTLPENKLSTSASPHKELSSQSDPTDSTSPLVYTESIDQSKDPYVPTWENDSTFPPE